MAENAQCARCVQGTVLFPILKDQFKEMEGQWWNMSQRNGKTVMKNQLEKTDG